MPEQTGQDREIAAHVTVDNGASDLTINLTRMRESVGRQYV